MMPSVLNPRAPKLSTGAGDLLEMERLDALNAGQQRAMERGRQTVRPGRYGDSGIVCWLVQDVRGVEPRPEPWAEIGERVHTS